MLKLCGPPTISAKQSDHFGLRPNEGGYGLMPREELPEGYTTEARPLESIAHMLLGVPELRVVIRSRQSMYPTVQYAEDVRLHALLRWMSAVLAARRTPLRGLTVVVKLDSRWSELDTCSEPFGILLNLRSKHLVLESERPGTNLLPPLVVDEEGQVETKPCGSWQDVEQTWADLLDTTTNWPRQPWRPTKFARLLRARKWFQLWEAFGQWVRGEL